MIAFHDISERKKAALVARHFALLLLLRWVELAIGKIGWNGRKKKIRSDTRLLQSRAGGQGVAKKKLSVSDHPMDKWDYRVACTRLKILMDCVVGLQSDLPK